MGLMDKASKVLDAVRRGDPRGAASALSDVIDDARVRVMDEVVSRVSGHAVHTELGQEQQDDLPSTRPVAPRPDAKGPSRPVAAQKPEPAPKPAKAAPQPAAPAKANPTPSMAKAAAPSPPPSSEAQTSDRLVLVARDPTWAFAHWSFSRERLAKAASGLVDPRALLRFYEVGSETPLIDADVSPESGRYYLRVPRAGRSYEARLAFVDARGQVREVARSNDAEPPLQQVRRDEALPRFVHTDAQSAILAARDQVRVPPPRLIVDLEASAVDSDRPDPRNPQWAGVLAELRGRRVAEATGAAAESPEGSGRSGLAQVAPAPCQETVEAPAEPAPWVAPSIKSSQAPRSS